MLVYLTFQATFLERGVFVHFFKVRVLFLQFLVLPTSSSVLEPDGNLSRVETKLHCEPVLPFGLQFVLTPKVLLQKINLLFTQLPLLVGFCAPVFSPFALLNVTPPFWLLLP